ncbi:hypothetical protein BC835DRAFT_1262389, partial [Cytidiella melzeri]
RCLKCQKVGVAHIAANCQAIHDTCGTCGVSTHATRECTVTDPARYQCSNCRLPGHAAWSRTCPYYLRKKRELMDRCSESRYTYFPTNADPRTWETVEPERAQHDYEDHRPPPLPPTHFQRPRHAPPPNFDFEFHDDDKRRRDPPPTFGPGPRLTQTSIQDYSASRPSQARRAAQFREAEQQRSGHQPRAGPSNSGPEQQRRTHTQHPSQ